jgi:YcxB-like protein
MTAPDQISGLLSEKDQKRLIRLSRRGAVGPTAIYYAGVTAPIISASMSVMVRNAMEMAGFSPYWQWFLSALVAAFAGISWYLIFIRWSYRSHGDEVDALKIEISVVDDYLKVRRGGIETRIDWSSVLAVKSSRGFTSIKVQGADALIIPDDWFNKDKQARRNFVERLKQKAGV